MRIGKITAVILAVFMLFTTAFAADTEISTGALFDDILSGTDGSSQTETDVSTDELAAVPETETEKTKQVSFKDIPADSSYSAAVTKLVECGVINGYEDNTFRPENGVTRAEMCKMINLTFNYVALDSAAGFPDVTDDKWYKPYALAAQQQGYVEGYEDGTFRGENNITRQEVCMIINRIVKPMDLTQFGLTVNITDEVSDWAKQAVELIVMNNLMPLEENNTFRAKENIKRYELAVLLSSFVVAPVEPLTAQVRFFNGETQIGETDTVLIGDVPNVPEAPVHPDQAYEFLGWRVVGQTDLIDAYSYMIVEDTDYEAVFGKKTFKVDFYDGAALYHTVTVEYGDAPTPPLDDPETAGYDFLGWSYQDGGVTVNVRSLIITSDTILYSVFKKSELGGGGTGGGTGGGDSGEDDGEIEDVYYDVYFYFNDEVIDTQSVLGGTCAKKPDNPYADGLVFLGWSTKESGDAGDIINVTSYKIRKDTDFYAVTKKNPNDPELISTLQKGISQLDDIALTNNKHKTARTEMVACMQMVLNDALNGIYVDKNYVQTTYETEVAYVESLVLDEMTGREASEFKSILTNTNNVDEDVQDFLMDYFLDGEDIEV